MDELLKVAIQAARDAGKEIMGLYETSAFETKGDGSPVTAADIRSNEVLVQYLRETNLPILSEEMENVPLPYPPRMWIIDPIDGTRDFIGKTGDFAVMVGLLEHGKPTLGVVYAPYRDKLYSAMKGCGAELTEKGETRRLAVSSREREGLRCLQSIHHHNPRSAAAIEYLNAQSVPHGSIGVKGGFLAEDVGDFFFSWGKLGEWDVCAPEIIVSEAGGVVTDTNGDSLTYGRADHRLTHGMIFSNGACHGRVLEALQVVS